MRSAPKITQSVYRVLRVESFKRIFFPTRKEISQFLFINKLHYKVQFTLLKDVVLEVQMFVYYKYVQKNPILFYTQSV